MVGGRGYLCRPCFHIEWDTTAPVTPLGQLPFFIEYLKQGGLFDGWVADCPLLFTSPNAPRKRDVLGTLLLSVLAGHRRYAHVTALRCDAVNPPLLGMSKVVSEDALRRALAKIDETAGMQSVQGHLDYCVRPLLEEPWVLDVDDNARRGSSEPESSIPIWIDCTALLSRVSTTKRVAPIQRLCSLHYEKLKCRNDGQREMDRRIERLDGAELRGRDRGDRTPRLDRRPGMAADGALRTYIT